MCSTKKAVLKNFAKFTGKHLCQSIFFNARVSFLLNNKFIKKVTLAQVFSCEFCEVFKNTFLKQNRKASKLTDKKLWFAGKFLEEIHYLDL